MREQAPELSVTAIRGVPEVTPGAVLADLLLAAMGAQGVRLQRRDCLVVTQKVVSKAEGRLVPVDESDPEARLAVIEAESVRVLRRRGDLVISETRHGLVCANAGVDLSNVDEGWAALLPVDPDRSARRIRDRIRAREGLEIAVVISDTFGRPWRHGLVDVAIGVAGLAGVVDLRGQPDQRGRPLQVTEVAIADEVASAAELVMGKAQGIPAAVVRGLHPDWMREGSASELIRPHQQDLFR